MEAINKQMFHVRLASCVLKTIWRVRYPCKTIFDEKHGVDSIINESKKCDLGIPMEVQRSSPIPTRMGARRVKVSGIACVRSKGLGNQHDGSGIWRRIVINRLVRYPKEGTRILKNAFLSVQSRSVQVSSTEDEGSKAWANLSHVVQKRQALETALQQFLQ